MRVKSRSKLCLALASSRGWGVKFRDKQLTLARISEAQLLQMIRVNLMCALLRSEAFNNRLQATDWNFVPSCAVWIYAYVRAYHAN